MSDGENKSQTLRDHLTMFISKTDGENLENSISLRESTKDRHFLKKCPVVPSVLNITTVNLENSTKAIKAMVRRQCTYWKGDGVSLEIIHSDKICDTVRFDKRISSAVLAIHAKGHLMER